MRWWFWGALALVGCKSQQDVLTEHGPYFAKQHARMEKIATALEAQRSDKGKACKPMKLDFDSKSEGYDADFINFGHLLDQSVDLKKEGGAAIDLLASDLFDNCLLWTSPQSPLSGSADASGLEKSLIKCKKVKYLVVASQSKHDREAGVLGMRFDVVDIAKAKPLCSFTAVASADPNLEVKYYDIIERNTRTGEERWVGSDSSDEYSSALWSAARRAYTKAVKEHLGVTVKL